MILKRGFLSLEPLFPAIDVFFRVPVPVPVPVRVPVRVGNQASRVVWNA